MKERSRKQILLDTIGTAGYVAATVQWLWLCLLFMPSFLHSPLFTTFIMPTTATSQAPEAIITTSSGSAPLWAIVFAVVVGIIAVVGGIYALIRLPGSIGKGGETITHTPVEILMPKIAKRQHLKPKQRLVMSRQLLFVLKLLLCVIPAVTVLFVSELPDGLTRGVIAIISLFLFAWSFCFFILQALIAKVVGVGYETIR